MLQQKPDDFVIATGKTYTVKKFLEMVAKKLRMKIVWKGKVLTQEVIIKENYY